MRLIPPGCDGRTGHGTTPGSRSVPDPRPRGGRGPAIDVVPATVRPSTVGSTRPPRRHRRPPMAGPTAAHHPDRPVPDGHRGFRGRPSDHLRHPARATRGPWTPRGDRGVSADVRSASDRLTPRHDVWGRGSTHSSGAITRSGTHFQATPSWFVPSSPAYTYSSWSRPYPNYSPPVTSSAARSATTMVGAFVFPPGMVGRTEASTTRNPSTPWTRSSSSTTAKSSVPILQVPTGW